MKDMMALAAERTAKLLGKVLPDTGKPESSDNANVGTDVLNARPSSNAGGKKEKGNE